MRIEGGEIVAARIFLDGVVPAGTVLEARLARAGKPAIAVAGGQEYVLRDGAPRRHRGPGDRHRDRPRGHPRHGALEAAAGEAERRGAARISGWMREALPFPSPRDALEEAGWHDLLEEARSGIVAFTGGGLRISPTPAMTLIDVDGTLPTFELAMAGAKAAARTILRHGIGGSIGIDLPTVQGKEQRTAIGAAVDAILPNPFERTAVNGFGFLQIVRPRLHASLFELAADRAGVRGAGLAARGGDARPARCASPPIRPSSPCCEARPDWLEALSPAGRRRGRLALRRQAHHVRRPCRESLNPAPRAAHFAAIRARPSMPRSARAGAGTATCLKWLGEGYRIAGPPAEEQDLAGVDRHGRRRLGSAPLRTDRPVRDRWAQVAQLVEHVTENHGVGGSIPSLGTILARSDPGASASTRIRS